MAATVTEAGTVSFELLLTRVTTAPPAGAALLRVTVQVLEAFAPRLEGLQAIDDTSVAAVRLTVAVPELAPSFAATTAALSLAITPTAEAVKVAVLEPAGILTEAGTESATSVLESVATEPPVGATRSRLTVQRADPPCPRAAGAQLSEEMFGTAISAAPGDVRLNPAPVESTANRFVNATDVVVAAGVKVTTTVAAIPDVIALAFKPVIKQVEEPKPDTHVIDLLARVAAGPTAIEMPEI